MDRGDNSNLYLHLWFSLLGVDFDSLIFVKIRKRNIDIFPCFPLEDVYILTYLLVVSSPFSTHSGLENI